MPVIRLARAARADIVDLLAWSLYHPVTAFLEGLGFTVKDDPL